MRSSGRSAAIDTLVIGYGNDLRGDDAAGIRAAQALAARGLPGVEVRCTTQLIPELAADLAHRRLILLDAAVDLDAVHVQRLDPAAAAQITTHRFHAGTLLGLARVLGTGPQEAWLVTIPAADLRLGAPLSRLTAAAVGEAVAVAEALCRP